MSFLKKLFSGAPHKPDKRYYIFNAKCNRCGEIIEGRVDLDNDLSLNDEGDGFIVRKGLMGSGDNHCFQQIEVTIQFSSLREVLKQDIHDGIFFE